MFGRLVKWILFQIRVLDIKIIFEGKYLGKTFLGPDMEIIRVCL